jgi:hypothetical protein
MKSVPRNFVCPLTGEPCVEGGCKRDAYCVAKERELAAEAKREEHSLQWKIRHGRATLEDLGLGTDPASDELPRTKLP